MALGVAPVICDNAGPAELVDDQTGYKVTMGSRSQIVTRLRDILSSIIADPSSLPKKAEAAKDRVCRTSHGPPRQRRYALFMDGYSLTDKKSRLKTKVYWGEQWPKIEPI